MNRTLKTFATAILAAGATVTATKALATDTNTFTNVIQDVTISLTVYSNAPIKSSTSQTGEKPVALTTKSVITALSNASANIPSLVGFDWGKSPQLVINTTFSATNVVTYTNTALTNDVATLALATNGAAVLSFQTSTNGGLGTNDVTIPVGSTATITNQGGTNLVILGTNTTVITNDSDIAYVGTNGLTNLAPLDTNASFTTLAATLVTNAGVTNTNVVVTAFLTKPSATNAIYTTNGGSSVKIKGGTATAPTFVDVSGYVTGGTEERVIETATGTGLGTTNASVATETVYAIKNFGINVFNTTAGTAIGNNLSLSLQGFGKGTSTYDVLHKSRTATNEVQESTSTASVGGYGYIGGYYVTNSSGTNYISISVFPTTEYSGTNLITNGIITNPIPVVVEGTISLGSPKSVPQ
jgi:hypothetical protein